MTNERKEQDDRDEHEDAPIRSMEALHRRFSDLRREVQNESRAMRESLSSHNTRIALVEQAQKRQKESADEVHEGLRDNIRALERTIKDVRDEVRSMIGGVGKSVTDLASKFDGHIADENRDRKNVIYVLGALVLSILGFLGVQLFLKVWGGG